jgi:hypothetical protein
VNEGERRDEEGAGHEGAAGPVAVVVQEARPRPGAAARGLPGRVRWRGEGAVRDPDRVREPPPVQGAAGGGRGGARPPLRGGRPARAAVRRRRVRARRGGDPAGDAREEDDGGRQVPRRRRHRHERALGGRPRQAGDCGLSSDQDRGILV